MNPEDRLGLADQCYPLHLEVRLVRMVQSLRLRLLVPWVQLVLAILEGLAIQLDLLGRRDQLDLLGRRDQLHPLLRLHLSYPRYPQYLLGLLDQLPLEDRQVLEFLADPEGQSRPWCPSNLAHLAGLVDQLHQLRLVHLVHQLHRLLPLHQWRLLVKLHRANPHLFSARKEC